MLEFYLTQGLDTFNEKTVILSCEFKKFQKTHEKLIKHYEEMPIPKIFKEIIAQYLKTPDPFVKFPRYYRILREFVCNELRVEQKRKFICWQIFFREIPEKNFITTVSLIHFIPLVDADYYIEKNMLFKVIRQDYAKFIHEADAKIFEYDTSVLRDLLTLDEALKQFF